jgi:formate hydrogenlyase subunit 3/multisubunit Na+/H+ antiporter MnhD subunit
MVDGQSLLIFLIFPFMWGLIIWILGDEINDKIKDFFNIFGTTVIFILSILTFSGVFVNKTSMTFTSCIGLVWDSKLRVDLYSGLLAVLISFLGWLSSIYSVDYMKHYEGRKKSYYPLLLFFIGSMNGAIVSWDFITMFFFWELMSLFAFLLVIFDRSETSINAGIKYLMMNGAGSLLMLFAIGFLYFSYGNADIEMVSKIVSHSPKAIVIISLLFLIGLGVKAGIVPIHTWLIEAHPAAPSPISALLSGVMIKVGVYWIFRIGMMIYSISNFGLYLVCALGALTILVGSMMLLVENDIKRLLAYSSVSQIGYIILGIGTGISVGVYGGLFHLINHALFKGLLFLCAGAIIYRTGTRKLSDYGGLSRVMPVTFITSTIAALAISGVPPFNGFVSKWMIYQGIIEVARNAPQKETFVWWMFLAIAVFGSALTFSAYMKIIFSTFLSEEVPRLKRLDIKEVGLAMQMPLIVLAILCVIFGIFPNLPLNYFLSLKTGGSIINSVSLVGIWNPTLATMLILIGIVLGGIIYFSTKIKIRREDIFIGGEKIDSDKIRFDGTAMYNTIKEMGILKCIYDKALKGRFDAYNYSVELVDWFSEKIYKNVDRLIDNLYDGIAYFVKISGEWLNLYSIKISWLIFVVLIASFITGNLELVRWTSIFVMLFYGLVAIGENKVNRFIVWSILSQLGYYIFGLSFEGGKDAVIYYGMFSFISWLIMAISLLYLKGERDEIKELSKMAEKKPYLSVLFIIGAFGLVGLPPLTGFIGKFKLSSVAMHVNLLYSFILILSALITTGYILKVIKVVLEDEISKD